MFQKEKYYTCQPTQRFTGEFEPEILLANTPFYPALFFEI